MITEYLGKNVSDLLKDEPFRCWPVVRSIEMDLEEPLIQYVFEGHSLALRCDRDDIINVIFLRAELVDSQGEGIYEVPFSWSQKQVIEHFGPPSKSGKKVSDPILGEYGAWDRFERTPYAVHIEYRVDRDEIKRITLMCNEAIPR